MLALDAFLASVQTKALRIAELGLRDRDDALDVVQDSMYKFVQKYAHKPEAQWAPLFYRILYNRITDVQRARTRNRFLSVFSSVDLASTKYSRAEHQDFLEQVADERPVEPDRLNQSDRFANELEKALLELPERQRQAFLLREWEGLDVAETATAMGCSTGSVKTHLSRAKQALQKRLQEHH